MYETDLNCILFVGQTCYELFGIDIFPYRRKCRGFYLFVWLSIERYGGGLRTSFFGFLCGLFYARARPIFY